MKEARRWGIVIVLGGLFLLAYSRRPWEPPAAPEPAPKVEPKKPDSGKPQPEKKRRRPLLPWREGEDE